MRSNISLFLGLCACSAWAQSSTGVLATKQRIAGVRVDAVVEDFLDRTPIPGIVVAFVDRGDLLALRGRGLADLQTGRDMDPSTTQILAGGLVRPFTAAAVLHLSDRGDLDLSSDIDSYLNRFAPRSSVFSPVTPMHLLTNTAGFDGRLTATRARSATDILPLADYLQLRLLPRIRPPGVVSISSDFGFGLAGLLVEEVSGKSFSTYMEARLFAPLGMKRTTVLPLPWESNSLATGYRLSAEGPEPVVPDYPQAIPSSWLITTAGDMSLWMRMILGGGRLDCTTVLEPASVALLLSEQFVNHPIMPGTSFGMTIGVRNTKTVLSSGYRGNGFSALLNLVPDQEIGLFLGGNAEVDLSPAARALLSVLTGPETDTDIAVAEIAESSPRNIEGMYRDASISQGSPEKLLSLFNQYRAETSEDDALVWRGRDFPPLGDMAFEDNTGDRIAIILAPEQQTYLVTPNNTFERLRWYEWWPLHAALWWLFATAFLAITWTRTPLPKGRADLSPPTANLPHWPFRLARLSSWFYFAFIVSAAVWISGVLAAGPEDLTHGVGPWVRGLFALPKIAFLLSVPVIASVPVAWVRGQWSKRLRWRMLWIALALLAFVPFLRYWKVLGFQI